MRTALLPRSFSRDGSSVPLLRPCSFARHIARHALCYRDLRVPNYMLANDSNEGKNQSEFFLVIRAPGCSGAHGRVSIVRRDNVICA